MSKTIWALIEIEDGRAARSSLEVLSKAAHLGRAEAIVLGSAAVFGAVIHDGIHATCFERLVHRSIHLVTVDTAQH